MKKSDDTTKDRIDIPKKPKHIPLSNNDWEQVVKDWFDQNISLQEMADGLNWPAKTLANRMKSAGLPRKSDIETFATRYKGVIPSLDRIPNRKKHADLVDAFFWSELQKRIQAIPVIEYPITQKKPVKAGKDDEEIQVGLFSDSHPGIKTQSFNSEIFRERVRTYANGLIRIADLHRKAYPINKLVLLCIGDLIHGERVGKQVNLDEFECPAHEQILDIFVPAFCEMLINLRPHYKEIEIHSVEGNHGWPGGKDSAYGSNWDTFAMELVKAKMAEFKDISIEVERESFFKIVNIAGHNFLMMHGDQIPMHMTLPFYGLTNRALRLRGSIDIEEGHISELIATHMKSSNSKKSLEELVTKLLRMPFEYFCVGHFHTRSNIIFNDVEIFMNGTFSSGDQYPLKKMGLSGKPEQWSLGVHENKGVTWRYPIKLA